MDFESFFTVHKDLPREGPGCPDDVNWAFAQAPLAPGAVICDVGAGPGGDIAALLAVPTTARVVAVEKHIAFAEAAKARFADDPRVSISCSDMADLATHPDAPFDAIWCAGALYFLGLEDGLALMADCLKPGGVLAFSEPCFFVDAPSDRAQNLWEGYPASTREVIAQQTEVHGLDVVAQRNVGDTAWEAYYQPMEQRIAMLRPNADARLTQMLDLCAQEAQDWRDLRHETGYCLTVARKR